MQPVVHEMQMIGAPSTTLPRQVEDMSYLAMDYMEFLDYQKNLQARGGDMQPVALPDLAAPLSEEKKQEPKHTIDWDALWDAL